MLKMDINSLEKLINSKSLSKPIYIFSGPEFFLKNKMFSLMVDSFVPKEDQKDNVFKYICDTKSLNEATNQFNSFTFNLSPRFFYLQDFDNIPTKQRKPFYDTILNNGIPQNTYLIFTTNETKTATDIFSKLKQLSEKIDFWAPFANQLPNWVKKECIENGADMTTEAADLLIELAGSDLALLHQEVKKLALGFSGRTIGIKEVRNSVAYMRHDTIFDLINAFGMRDATKMLRILETLLNNGESPQKIWYMLCKQIRDYRLFHDICIDRPDVMGKIKNNLMQYARIASKSDFNSNMDKKNILSEIQSSIDDIPPQIVSACNLNNQNSLKKIYMAFNFTHSKLIKLWPEILKTDLSMKSGNDATLALTSFMLKAISKEPIIN